MPLDDTGKALSAGVGAGQSLAGGAHGLSGKRTEALLRVEATPALWSQEICPRCLGKLVGGDDHGPERQWRQLNLWQLPSENVCAPPCVQCKTDQKFWRALFANVGAV